MRIRAVTGDITTQWVDAIVNAANEVCLGGGGVDGAIHRAAGPKLLEACQRLPKLHGVRCPTGQARITPGFELPAEWVIHAVGPIYRHHPDPPAALASAFRSSLELAEKYGVRRIAFPAISCGAYGYPVREAAHIAVKVASERAWDLDEIRFVLFDEPTTEVFQREIDQLSAGAATTS